MNRSSRSRILIGSLFPMPSFKSKPIKLKFETTTALPPVVRDPRILGNVANPANTPKHNELSDMVV